MKVITLLNEKGGVGKTTAATTIAAGLAIKGYRVLLADADPQGNATQAFGIEPYGGFYDAFKRKLPFVDTCRIVSPMAVCKPDEVSNYHGELYLLGGNVETRHLAGDDEDMELILNRMYELEESNAIDYVIFDTSPTPTMLHSKLYLATDGVLYPTRLEAWSLGGLNRSMSYRVQADRIRKGWDMDPIDFIGILPLMCRMSTTEHVENHRLLKDKYGDKMMRPIAQRTAWAESAAACTSIFAYTMDSQVIKDAWQIVNPVLEYATT